MNAEEAVRGDDEVMVETAGGVRLCAQGFGRAGDPVVLLISGMASPMDWWEEEFCGRLAAGGRRVVRYDHRDTGRSQSFPAGAPPYTGRALSDDALGLLDALGVARAHLVGVSAGGGVGQCLAVEHPERVATLTLIATSPVDRADPDAPELPMVDGIPGPPPDPDWSDRAAVVAYLVESVRPYAGSLGFDEARVREVARRIVDRTRDMAASERNHWVAMARPGAPLRGRLADVTAPTLVMHGTEDPAFPFPHGEALAAEIPGARLMPLEGAGHEVPPRPLWDAVIEAILDHTADRPGPS